VTDLRDLRGLETQFCRAPSAHNTQPWILEYGPDRVELHFDPARALPAGDPTRRDLLLSLGALAEAVLIAASSVGIAVEFEPAFEAETKRVGTFRRAGSPYTTPFTSDDLALRQTSRAEYTGGRLTGDDLAAARSQVAGDAELRELPTRELVDLDVAAERHLYESPAVVEELRSWLRLSRRHPRYELDGLSYECLGLAQVEATAVALLLRRPVYRVVRLLRLHRRFTAATTSLLERDGSALVLEGAAETPEEVLSHGRSLLRAWLALARRGLYTHPLSQILDYQATERELSARVGAAAEHRLLCVFRAGRSEPPPRSSRRPAGLVS
jgi:hypothetical protein